MAFRGRKISAIEDIQAGLASMRKMWIMVFAACIGLAGSATVLGGELLSATGAVIAILAGDLFVGEAEGHLSGAGTLAIHSQKDPALTCLGQFTSSAELGGSGQMHCSDGTTATFHFQRLTMFCGYGVGNFGRGSMSFAYGLTPEDARPYLKLPEGKKLTHNGTELELVALMQSLQQ
jgi:hypothetical protein